MKLNLPRRTKRRLPTRIRQPLAAPAGLNQSWALDFMVDTLYDARLFRTLNIIDEGNRQVLGIEIAHSIPSLRVIRVMEQLIELHGKPRALRLDNGPELTAIAFTDAYVFETVDQVRDITESWLHEYTEERPHDSLGRVPPLTFMPRSPAVRESSFKLCP